MHGSAIGKLNFYAKTKPALGRPTWTRSGDNGDQWQQAVIALPTTGTYTVSCSKQIKCEMLFWSVGFASCLKIEQESYWTQPVAMSWQNQCLSRILCRQCLCTRFYCTELDDQGPKLCLVSLTVWQFISFVVHLSADLQKIYETGHV